ncbi:MAG: serine hydrolase domain-containing protein [Lysobacter sp.]
MKKTLFALAVCVVPMLCAQAAAASDSPSAVASAAAGLASNTPQTTSRGTRLIAPKGWRVRGSGKLIALEAPEGGSHVVVAERDEVDPDAAVRAAWASSGLAMAWLQKSATDDDASNGWTKVRTYDYALEANDGRVVSAKAHQSEGGWTVVLTQVSTAVRSKRSVQLATIIERLHAAGFEPESFVGRQAHALDDARVRAMTDFITNAQRELAIPGVAIGLIQDGRTVFADGFGSRVHGRPETVDADTRFAIGSNTKALTTLMLAKLVEQGRFAWDTPVVNVFPGFRIGDAQTTRQMQIQHLVCACTGLPRQDMEWWYEYANATPASKVAELAKMVPTSGFGELYQYSNPLAAAGGYVGAHAMFPELELGVAYDRAMQELVFDPLGMHDTTLDFRRAQTGNAVLPHGEDVHGRTTALATDTNNSVIPMRPAGGAWSSVRDMLRYIQMELDRGELPDGSRYIDASLLAERTREKVPDGADSSYGMGLSVDRSMGIPVVYHGGAVSGILTDMIWLPEHGVGAVILTNSDSGGALLAPFRRKLLEVLFDGKPLADTQVATAAAQYREHLASERKRVTLPGDERTLAKLAPRYRHPSLGQLDVHRANGRTVLDFGEWKSEAATRTGESTEVVRLISPGLVGVDFVLGMNGARRTLSTTQGPITYVFEEVL